jgi:hypothetical protein
MTAKQATVTLALTAALALAGQPARARGSHQGGGGHSGGGHSGGGYSGGGHAVPRGGGGGYGSPGYHPGGGGGHGSPGYYPGGGMAAARHPQAGTGGYGYGYGYRPYYGGHYRPYYGGYYRPYYGGYYGGYYGYWPYTSASFYFGWPSYYSSWWPYASVSYYAPTYGYRYDDPAAPPASDASRPYGDSRTDVSDRDAGRVRLEVRPEDASVYVDDAFRGNGRETKFLTLRPGPHVIELVRPGFAIARREVEVVRGETRDVLVELR